jgi:hypothetical protein
MPRSLGNVIADSLQLSLGYAERLLRGVAPERAARFAAPGGAVVESNHPVFIYGHLSLYAPKMLRLIGHPAPPVPGGFELVFSKDAKCVDDGDGTFYPPLDQVVAFFLEGHRMTTGALRSAAAATFEEANPAEGRMKELFPTIGSVEAFYCGGHMMMHLGQLSAWRRMEGLGSA